MIQHVGVARWAYNWGLTRNKEHYEVTGKYLSAIDLNKELISLKHTEEYSWIKRVSKCAPQNALRHLDTSFKKFFSRCKRGEHKKGFPKYKSRRRSKDSFKIEGCLRILPKHIRLLRIGNVRLRELDYLPDDARITSATITREAGRWFVSVKYDMAAPAMSFNQTESVGVDLGLKHLAVMSNGEVLPNPRTLRRYELRLSRLQRNLSRKKKGSNNRSKAILKIQKLWFRIRCTRNDYIHKFTTAITKQYKQVVIEDLCIKGMMSLRPLAKSVSDARLYEIRRQLEYKGKWYGCDVILADRFFPSTKLCSNCNNKKDSMSMSSRTYECDTCGFTQDRDLNAAINLKNLTDGSSGLVCGEDVRHGSLLIGAHAASAKQELNFSHKRL